MTAGPIVYLFIYLAEISYLTLEKKINWKFFLIFFVNHEKFTTIKFKCLV
jgi:hypothetical protein